MRMLFTTAILVFTVSTLSAAGQAGHDGERLYQQYCARCHDADMPTVFMQGTIQDLSAERVYEALVYFFMQRNAATLTKAQKRAVAEHVAGSAPGSLVPAIDQVPRAAYCEAGTAQQAIRCRERHGTDGVPDWITPAFRPLRRPASRKSRCQTWSSDGPSVCPVARLCRCRRRWQADASSLGQA